MFWSKKISPKKKSPTKKSPNSQYNAFLTRKDTNWRKDVLEQAYNGMHDIVVGAYNLTYAGASALSAITRMAFKSFRYVGKSSLERNYKNALKAVRECKEKVSECSTEELEAAEARVVEIRTKLHKSHDDKRVHLLSEIQKYALELNPNERNAFTKLATEKITQEYEKAMAEVATMKGGLRRSRRLRR